MVDTKSVFNIGDWAQDENGHFYKKVWRPTVHPSTDTHTVIYQYRESGFRIRIWEGDLEESFLDSLTPNDIIHTIEHHHLHGYTIYVTDPQAFVSRYSYLQDKGIIYTFEPSEFTAEMNLSDETMEHIRAMFTERSMSRGLAVDTQHGRCSDVVFDEADTVPDHVYHMADDYAIYLHTDTPAYEHMRSTYRPVDDRLVEQQRQWAADEKFIHGCFLRLKALLDPYQKWITHIEIKRERYLSHVDIYEIEYNIHDDLLGLIIYNIYISTRDLSPSDWHEQLKRRVCDKWKFQGGNSDPIYEAWTAPCPTCVRFMADSTDVRIPLPSQKRTVRTKPKGGRKKVCTQQKTEGLELIL